MLPARKLTKGTGPEKAAAGWFEAMIANRRFCSPAGHCHYRSHSSSVEFQLGRKPLLLAEKIGHPHPSVSIILLQRGIDWLLAAFIVDQPKPALAAIPDFIVVYFQ